MNGGGVSAEKVRTELTALTASSLQPRAHSGSGGRTLHFHRRHKVSERTHGRIRALKIQKNGRASQRSARKKFRKAAQCFPTDPLRSSCHAEGSKRLSLSLSLLKVSSDRAHEACVISHKRGSELSRE